MRKVTYICNLCRTEYENSHHADTNMKGVIWEPVANAIHLAKASECEHHICNRCLNALDVARATIGK